MIDKLLGIVGLFKELPDAVGYEEYGPIRFALPLELQEAIGQSEARVIGAVKTVLIRIDNFTNREVKEISILYRGSFHYTPRISFGRRDTQPTYSHQTEDKTILIPKLPPKESVRLEIYFDEDETFDVDCVMAEGRLITKWMQKIAEIYRYPGTALLSILASCVVLAALLTGVWATYTVSSHNEKNRIVREAMSNWDGCTPTPFENKIGSEPLLERKFRQQAKFHYAIYELNNVNSFDELKIKDLLILCEPTNR